MIVVGIINGFIISLGPQILETQKPRAAGTCYDPLISIRGVLLILGIGLSLNTNATQSHDIETQSQRY
jgi:hypothetical protein